MQSFDIIKHYKHIKQMCASPSHSYLKILHQLFASIQFSQNLTKTQTKQSYFKETKAVSFHLKILFDLF